LFHKSLPTRRGGRKKAGGGDAAYKIGNLPEREKKKNHAKEEKGVFKHQEKRKKRGKKKTKRFASYWKKSRGEICSLRDASLLAREKRKPLQGSATVSRRGRSCFGTQEKKNRWFRGGYFFSSFTREGKKPGHVLLGGMAARKKRGFLPFHRKKKKTSRLCGGEITMGALSKKEARRSLLSDKRKRRKE